MDLRIDGIPTIPHDVYYDAPSEPMECRFEDDRYFYDPSDDYVIEGPERHAFTLTLDHESVMKNAIDDFLDQIPSDELLGMHEPFDTYAYGLRTAVTMQHAAKLQPYLGYRPLEVVRRTIEYTTQLG
jgi:hypothetical protein